MSIRVFQSTVIDCDFCDAVYSDTAEVSLASMLKFAVRDGWLAMDTGLHACPACVGKAMNPSKEGESHASSQPLREREGQDHHAHG